MNQVFAEILSPAIGVLISPFPIVGLILILLSKRARSNSVFYMLGWMVGSAAMFLIGLFFMDVGAQQGEPGLVSKIVSLVLGALLIVFAVREFLKRPKKGETPKTPKWFEKMSQIKIWGAAGFGFFLSALNIKNALLSLGAGAAVGALGLTWAQQAGSTVIYVLLASAVIIVLTVAFLILGDRIDEMLENVSDWLIDNNSVIMSVLMLLLGVNLLVKAF